MKSINIIVVLAIHFALVYADFEQDVLKDHNNLRAKHSSPPLTLDAQLNKDCADYAKVLSDKDVMEHSNVEGVGENLYYSTGSALKCSQAWYDEIKDYDFKKGEFSLATGHFTQLVWKDTKKLGVGKHTGTHKKTYVVCRYTPPGNYKGEFIANVLPSSKSSLKANWMFLFPSFLFIIHEVFSCWNYQAFLFNIKASCISFLLC